MSNLEKTPAAQKAFDIAVSPEVNAALDAYTMMERGYPQEVVEHTLAGRAIDRLRRMSVNEEAHDA